MFPPWQLNNAAGLAGLWNRINKWRYEMEALYGM